MKIIITILMALMLSGCGNILNEPPMGGELSVDEDVIIEKTVREQLTDKSSKEKASFKSKEISKVKIDKFTKKGIEIEIIGDITEIDGGIELFAKAWKDGKQLGFGKDGTVEIERFRFYNPPVLVDDVNGDIVREWTDDITKEKKQRKLKYDPTQAVKESLLHTILQVAKDDKNIVKGKIGNTTSTFYGATGGYNAQGNYYNLTSSWSTTREIATSNVMNTAQSSVILNYLRHNVSGTNWGMMRSFLAFDTSDIDTGDVISSATLSLNCVSISGINTEVGIGVIGPTTPADISSITTADYDQVGSLNSPQEIVTRPNIYDWDTSAYNDMALNATGLTVISKTGYTPIGFRNVYDIDNTELPAGELSDYVVVVFPDETGTTSDPKLVVEHSAADTFKQQTYQY